MALASVSVAVDVVNMALQRLGQPTIATMTESSRDANIANQIYNQNRDHCLMLFNWSCLRKRQTLDRSGKKAITNITAASPGHVTCSGHSFIANELITIESVSGMTQVNTDIFRVSAPGTDTLTLLATDGTNEDTSSHTAYTSGGYVYRYAGNDWSYVYDLPTDCLRVIELLDETFGMDDQYRWKHEKTYIYADFANAGIMYLKQETDPSVYTSDLVEVIVARLAWFVAMRVHAMKDLRQAMYGEYQAALARAKLTNAEGVEDDGEPEQLWADVR